MRVTVFGGSQPIEGSPAYSDALATGELLARAGHTVVTGGYMGTMEAVSRGAAEAGGHVIGVTCEEIGHYHGKPPNAWIHEELKERTLLQRLRVLIEGSDAAMALPGGPGTLTEIALMWNLMLAGSISKRPLVLIGDGWKSTWDTFYATLGDFTPPPLRSYLQFVGTPAQAVQLLDQPKH